MLAAPTDAQYAAVSARDARHDGWFILAVTSTGIYCRPSCPARTPRREHVRIAASAANAQAAGFRACRRCRPDASPGSPDWDARGDVAGRAMRLIGDGVVDREGVRGLAAQLGYSERHLGRILTSELGAGPLALARAQRAQTARILIETTELPMTQIALAAGFASLRQFNEVVREIFAATPTQLRAATRARSRPGHAGGCPAPDPAGAACATVNVRLAYREPLDHHGLWAFLWRRAMPGVELAHADGFSRTLRLPRGHARAYLTSGRRPGTIDCRLELEDLRDLAAAAARCRLLLDLDADPVAIDAALAGDPLLRASVGAAPGRRVPGAVDGFELAVRAILGQQVSVEAARTLAARLVDHAGETLRLAPSDADTPSQLFPAPAALVDAPLERLGIPGQRAASIRALANAVVTGALDLSAGADRNTTAHALLALPGIGPWTRDIILMRALRDPDRLPPADLVARQALGRRGAPAPAKQVADRSQAWQPWRSYALMHLWQPASPPPAVARLAASADRPDLILEPA